MKNVMVACLVVCMLAPVIAFAEKVGGGDLTFSPKGSGQVVFSHQMHVTAKGLKCTGCHYTVFQMSQGSYKMDMAKITKGDFCGKCHNGVKSFDVKDAKNCAKCHR